MLPLHQLKKHCLLHSARLRGEHLSLEVLGHHTIASLYGSYAVMMHAEAKMVDDCLPVRSHQCVLDLTHAATALEPY